MLSLIIKESGVRVCAGLIVAVLAWSYHNEAQLPRKMHETEAMAEPLEELSLCGLIARLAEACHGRVLPISCFHRDPLLNYVESVD